ncbi:MAG: abortive phage infection protein [Smithella sp.]|nr:abortive phage infection protein [Smithella sp.]
MNKELIEFASEHNGVITSRDVTHIGIPRVYLTRMVESGELNRVQSGVYVLPGTVLDEFAEIHFRCPKGVYSHGTALYLHDLSDRTPLKYTVTLPSSYNATHLLSVENLEIKKSIPVIYAAGITTIASPNGFIVPVYNIEKSICDVVRNKDKMDYQVVTDALKSFSKRPDKNLTRLMEYAKMLRIESAIRTYFEVLL